MIGINVPRNLLFILGLFVYAQWNFSTLWVAQSRFMVHAQHFGANVQLRCCIRQNTCIRCQFSENSCQAMSFISKYTPCMSAASIRHATSRAHHIRIPYLFLDVEAHSVQFLHRRLE